MDPINITIAEKLRKIRKEKGLSLDKAADLTGVSKAMLGQIERGVSNPTVSILWKIANGLKVSFSSFVEEDEPAVSLVKMVNVKPVVDEGGKYRVFPLFPYQQDKSFEFYTIFLEEGHSHKAEAHHAGVEEYITVSEGELIIDVDGQRYTIYEGDALRFKADRAHVYINESTGTTRFHLVIYYPH
ncbi:helix-turn-helix domain-containing protein [Salipaludibacillus agaradhaerens]|uniref:helix-turn-helix domain-containing protein n=1 Tax=Salipaludibacillus agaradhaerens TaxID=76935 RepID=UPI0021517166|nr:helix-turn-helix domain-containing protein [Salipaludibacillus agaradhaerens]MCR6105100.1 helix-turn-helix domain-containing protein [Salipaludibacillus agaradhaerens]MCR6117145.1 helix-turn-helix domain-containing protein [Salipaludibacillus agaradhaerens]